MDPDTNTSGSGPQGGPIAWAEQGRLPDSLVRAGIRRLNRDRLSDIAADDCETAADALNNFIAGMRAAPIALVPQLANEQHYEVPAAFFRAVLGKHLKYSCCYWDATTHALDEAEARALEITCARAGLSDGMQILELGCGWGSLSLWMAARYPASRIFSVSNSAPQRQYIEAQARARGLANLEVRTCDMNDFDTGNRFDRVVSVEMFEHMRNWGELFGRVRRWLKPDGRFFMHVFCHRSATYAFEDRGASDWMSRHFFSGGIMPGADLALRFPEHLLVERQWRWSGRHYERTANAWLERLDQKRAEVEQVFEPVYGAAETRLWVQRWRIFFMACAELFGTDGGQEWQVGHYLLKPRAGE